MREPRKYVHWVERPGDTWRAYFGGRELWIRHYGGWDYVVSRSDYTLLRQTSYPSLNLAKRAGSKWLREQACAKPAKPGGGRKR